MNNYSQTDRLMWIKHYEHYGNARFTCKFYSISPDTFYKWKRRYDNTLNSGLEDNRSRKPNKTRRRWDSKDLLMLRRLYDYQPEISFFKARRFLKNQNINLSISTIYRMKLLLDKINKL